MLGNKHHRHHSLSLKMGFWEGQRKALSPPRYLTRVWTPRSAFGAVAPVAVTEAPHCLLGLRPLRNQGGDSQREVINHGRESNRCGDVQEWVSVGVCE